MEDNGGVSRMNPVYDKVENCFKVLNTMAICNHPINSQMLDYFDIYDDRALSELKDRNIVAFKDDYYILNSFFREEIYSLISDEEKDSIKNKLSEFYSAQLPLKPSERIILLSRISFGIFILFSSASAPMKS